MLGDLIAVNRGRAAQAVRDVLLVAGAAAFVGALAQISIHLSFTPVPITGQTLGVLLAGTALGWRRAAAAMALYAIAGVAGVPWFAGHASGYVGASFGYIVGFFFAATACGYLAERGADRSVLEVGSGHARRRDPHLRLRLRLAGVRPAPQRVGDPERRVHAVRDRGCDQGRDRRRAAARGLEARRRRAPAGRRPGSLISVRRPRAGRTAAARPSARARSAAAEFADGQRLAEDGWVSADLLPGISGWAGGVQRLAVLTGAGISTDSGIPDFRGPSGLWTRDPAAEKMSTFQVYVADPEVRRRSWQARLSHPAWTAQPNAAHLALARVASGPIDVTVITQNIDGLHQRAGTPPDRVLELHGTMYQVVCVSCGRRTEMSAALDRVRAGEADPPCADCGGILKSATVMFGQQLDAGVLTRAAAAAGLADVFVAVGSTLTVEPAASLCAVAARAAPG